jgi:hypothetical protein
MKYFTPANLKSGIGPDYICKRLCPLRHAKTDFVFVPLSRVLADEETLPSVRPYIRASRANAAAARRKPPAPASPAGR